MTGKERADMNVEAIVVVIIIVVIVIIMIKIIRFKFYPIKLRTSSCFRTLFFSCDDPAFDPLKIPHFQKTKTKPQRRNVIYVHLYVVVGIF